MKLLFGCGYLGARVAEAWQRAGESLCVVTRSEERARSFRSRGWEAIVGDIGRQDGLPQLPPAGTVLFAVGFDRTRGQAIEEVYVQGLARVLENLPSTDTERATRVIYISTTGVYGPADDTQWIDESSPADPQRPGSRASLEAERLLASSRFAAEAVILRLAGIYGPDRVPFLDRLRAEEAIPTHPENYLNLIHVSDAVGAVRAAENYRPPARGPHLFCISDGKPVKRGTFYREVARQLGAKRPRFGPPDTTGGRASRSAGSKRIRNTRMERELRVHLIYPSYREGLAGILG